MASIPAEEDEQLATEEEGTTAQEQNDEEEEDDDDEKKIDDHEHMLHHDDEDEIIDCPICLDAMSAADLCHPVQCATQHCGYNFCSACIRSLLSSSQDDFVEASDGSRQVKIHLNCPNCRSDLSKSIRDTLLLRRSDAAMEIGLEDVDDGEARDVSMQRALEDEMVELAIEEARLREAEFFRIAEESDDSHNSDEQSIDDIFSSYEEWGVEADVVNGVHSSFRSPLSTREDKKEEDHRLFSRFLPVDKTLLGGLEDFMSEGQQENITSLMTSGDPDKLVEAAECLRKATGLCQRQGQPHSRRRGSVYELVAQAEKARRGSHNHRSKTELYHWQQDNHRATTMQIRQEAVFLRTHPLPVRMPKSVKLSLMNLGDDGKTLRCLKFCDDMWDGKVKDAFCRLTLGFRGRVSRKDPQHSGVDNILGGYGSVRVDMEKPRILVSSVKGEAGKQGVMRGDVVTHLNGRSVEGNADELVSQIFQLKCSYDSGNCSTTFLLGLNAERPVAEALKRRAMLQ